MSYVYTPPGYESGQQAYPVLYLLYGNGQIEAFWIWSGQANVIMDNLLADRKIKPMIVVMPYGHIPREIKPVIAARPSGTPEAVAIEKELLTAVKPKVESKCRVLKDREHRAIAGLPMGAAQSMSIGVHNLDSFDVQLVAIDDVPWRELEIIHERCRFSEVAGQIASSFHEAVLAPRTSSSDRHPFGVGPWPQYEEPS